MRTRLPRLRRRRLALASLAVGCGLAGQSKPARAQEAALELNLNARFGRMELAAEHVAPKARDQFFERRKAWGGSVRVADYDLTGLDHRRGRRRVVREDRVVPRQRRRPPRHDAQAEVARREGRLEAHRGAARRRRPRPARRAAGRPRAAAAAPRRSPVPDDLSRQRATAPEATCHAACSTARRRAAPPANEAAPPASFGENAPVGALR